MGDRLGAILVVSMAVLGFEAAIVGIVPCMWAASVASTPMTVVLMLMLVPVSAVAGTALGALLSVAVVAPLLVLAGWTGRRIGGRESWYWVPVLLAVVTAVPALGWAAEAEAGILPGLVVWLLGTAALAAPALAARRLLLPDRPYVTGGVMFGWVALIGTPLLLAALMLAVFSPWTGIVFEPPWADAVRTAVT
ncbi:hypothetical protein ACFYU9_11960 [Streptomyces sp. NPDC004327]|uniref:hypothetical protein n=1 Tax=unclassified Streptomyces TaxID=2593676 RepID=UPI0036BA75BA